MIPLDLRYFDQQYGSLSEKKAKSKKTNTRKKLLLLVHSDLNPHYNWYIPIITRTNSSYHIKLNTLHFVISASSLFNNHLSRFLRSHGALCNVSLYPILNSFAHSPPPSLTCPPPSLTSPPSSLFLLLPPIPSNLHLQAHLTPSFLLSVSRFLLLIVGSSLSQRHSRRQIRGEILRDRRRYSDGSRA